jgi:hypothetical protein
MQHYERLQHVREGTDYKAPLRAINETIEGLVHAGLIVRANEDGTLLTPEARALDAIGVQVERELRQRAEMIVALVDRLNAVETERELLTVELASLRTLYEKECAQGGAMPEIVRTYENAPMDKERAGLATA